MYLIRIFTLLIGQWLLKVGATNRQTIYICSNYQESLYLYLYLRVHMGI